MPDNCDSPFARFLPPPLLPASPSPGPRFCTPESPVPQVLSLKSNAPHTFPHFVYFPKSLIACYPFPLSNHHSTDFPVQHFNARSQVKAEGKESKMKKRRIRVSACRQSDFVRFRIRFLNEIKAFYSLWQVLLSLARGKRERESETNTRSKVPGITSVLPFDLDNGSGCDRGSHRPRPWSLRRGWCRHLLTPARPSGSSVCGCSFRPRSLSPCPCSNLLLLRSNPCDRTASPISAVVRDCGRGQGLAPPSPAPPPASDLSDEVFDAD